MKKALGFVKSRWPALLCVLVALAALPTLLVLSTSRHAGLKKDVQAELDSADRSLQQVAFRYEYAPLTPGGLSASVSRVPNKAMNAHLKEWYDHIQSEAGAVLSAAEAHNSAGKAPMLDGLFPEPEPAQRVAKLQEAARVWPRAHEEILRAARAGSPPAEAELFESLKDLWVKKLDLISTTRGAEAVTDEEVRRIRAEVSDARVTEYRDRAADLSFYGAPSVFAGVGPWTQTALPTMAAVWDWQWRLWIHQDLLGALEKANRDPDSPDMRLSLAEGPVKRVLRIDVAPWNLHGVQTPLVGDDITAEIPRNYSYSITGRSSWPTAPNPLYDIRYAEIDMLVDSGRLPRVLEAIASTNFMSIADVDIQDVEPGLDLAEGFVYGEGHIVRAVVLVETAWLRSWMKPLMPPEVRVSMGVDEGAPVEGEEESEERPDRRPPARTQQRQGGGSLR